MRLSKVCAGEAQPEPTECAQKGEAAEAERVAPAMLGVRLRNVQLSSCNVMEGYRRIYVNVSIILHFGPVFNRFFS